MAKIKYNHDRRIKGTQNSIHKAVHPGMIIRFKYYSKNKFDKSPLVLVLWNDYQGNKFHGINLNYLTENNIKKMFKKMNVFSTSPEKQIRVTEQNQKEQKVDDNLPNRNLLKKTYTRLKLPTFKEMRDGKIISKSEAMKEMKVLYQKVFKHFVKSEDIYRSYLYENIKIIKVIRYDIEGL